MGAKTYKYKFSFVIPVYNVEDYLAETVESILAQTMDFVQNCEIIFVNDGSADNSEEVCLRYKEQFPDNVTYIKQTNAGPGAARNRGAAVAQGKYINPLDSDDKLSPNTLQEVYDFFEKHYDEIDLVGIKWEFFEARTGPHPLNYKFTSDRVIDLTKEFENIQGSAAPAFFKQEVFRKFTFEPSVGRYSEDARFMGDVLLEKQKFGVVTKPTYFYRKRHSQTSSQDLNMTDKFWYLETPKRVWYDLFEYARRKQGAIPKFIQFMAMYDLQWRFKQQTQTALGDHELIAYKELLYGLLPSIDDDVILAQRQISPDHKLFILDKKYGESILQNATKKGYKYYYHGTEIYDFKQANPAFHIEILEAQDDGFHIEGFYGGFLIGDAKLQARSNDKIYNSQVVDKPKRPLKFLDEFISERSRYQFTIPTASGDIEIFVAGMSNHLPLETYRFSHLSRTALWAYRTCGTWLVSKQRDRLRVRPHGGVRRVGYELHYTALLAKRLKARAFLQQFAGWRQIRSSGTKTNLTELKWLLIPAKSAARNVYAIFYRSCYFIYRPFVHQPIWLVSDRIMTADDSGEILFEYLQRQKDLNAKVYFILSKQSVEYPRLKGIGPVLPHGGFRHKLFFLLADKVISSEATDSVINAFPGRVDDFIDLYKFDFVFLQHGIIRDDISRWLNRYNKNIKLFVTSVKPEHQSILDGNYGYNEKVVQLTGLPRYDRLQNKPTKTIIIMPTWREHLAGFVDAKTGQRTYNPNFKKSDYFSFYQGLMNDPRLLAAMKQHGYTGEFYLHPSFQTQIRDFESNDQFTIMQMPFDYPEAKSHGSLLVTDYSSVAFDFAYLKKPVIYAQYDNDSFYKLHTSQEGYFEYEKDGFGPVIYDFESAVRSIIGTMASGCSMESKYEKRVSDFFAYNDEHNSSRVYRAILQMSSRDADRPLARG